MARRKRPSRRGGGRRSAGIVGRLSVSSRGFGFIDTQDGEYHVSKRDMNGAMHGDTVVGRPIPNQRLGQQAAVVTRVIDRANTVIVGTYHDHDGFGMVVPRDRRIAHDGFVPKGRSLGAPDGAIVAAAVLAYPTRSEALQVEVTEVLALSDEDPTSIIDVIVAELGIEHLFSEGAMAQAEQQAVAADAALAAEPYRRDIRHRPVCTIDPADARDFDDAVDVEWVEDRVRLGVHIADVSHYVPWEGAIDRDARRRGTSVYLPDRVIPMLPEHLSNEVCSLRPGEDRLAFSVDMYVDQNGVVEQVDLYPSVIRSARRYSYDEVLAMLESALPFDSPEAEAQLRLLEEVTRKIAARRTAAGSLAFDSVEPKVRLDSEGKPVEIVVRTATRATEMIEHAMIVANESVASYLQRNKQPVAYRVHENPEPTALDGIWPLLSEFGYQLKADHEVSPKLYQRILGASHGKPEQYLVSLLLLRTLTQAYYHPENRGHFGLASGAYCHFTSPIRRYPDLMVHRILKDYLRRVYASGQTGRFPAASPDVVAMTAELAELCSRSSDTERVAETAERRAVKHLICEYLADKVGDRFAGIISSVTSYGIFVSLDNAADGLVHMSSLEGDTWVYDPQRHSVAGVESGIRYRIGQRVAVELVRVDPVRAHLDFVILNSHQS